MKVAYVFATSNASTFKLATMILPQLEAGNHGAQVTGMMFFDDNIFALRKGDEIGERLAAVAKEHGILLMVCDQCGTGSVKAKGVVDGVVAGCFPQLYGALGGSAPDQVITLSAPPLIPRCPPPRT